MKNIHKLFVILLIFIISLNFIGCGPSEELTEKKSEQFWKMSSYFPQSGSKIVGNYKRSSGFDGGYLKLNLDSTFLLREWTDIYDPTNPYVGNRGKYFIKADTLILEVKSVSINTSIFKKLFSNVTNDKIIDKLIQDSLNVHNKMYFKGWASLKDTNKALYKKLQDLNKFYIKRVGEYILLVRLAYKDLFIDELLKDFNYPQCVSCKNRIFSYFYTKKILK